MPINICFDLIQGKKQTNHKKYFHKKTNTAGNPCVARISRDSALLAVFDSEESHDSFLSIIRKQDPCFLKKTFLGFSFFIM